MHSRFRHIVAAIALAAIAWTALWPVVSSAAAALSAEGTPLCHQAGMEVGLGEAPQQPSQPGKAKIHCPLCIMALYVAFNATPSAPPFVYAGYVVARFAHDTAATHSFRSLLPPSRAPPLI